MKVICAGFPKTGTKSMANALRTLGYSVHDFEEHLEYNLENYVDFIEGRVGEEIFSEMYREVDAVVDQPACTLFGLILRQFPDSKVILMERQDSEAWLRSYAGMMEEVNTKYVNLFFNVQPWLSKTHRLLRKLNHFCLIQSTGQDSFAKPLAETSPSLWKDQYTRYNAAVKGLVAKDQLLIYKVGEGWDRLCEFLGHKVPDKDFPHENKAGTDDSIVNKVVKFNVLNRGDREARISLLKIFVAGSVILRILRFKKCI